MTKGGGPDNVTDERQVRALTEDEQRLLALVAIGNTPKDIAAELRISLEAVRERLQRLVMMHQGLSGPSEPPLPPAASAALAVPIQQPEEVPTHVGKHLRRKDDPPSNPS